MAKDITIQVTGQNSDGTLNVRQVGGDSGNPFMQQQSSQSMVPYNPNSGVASPTTGFKARIGNSDVIFASEADFLKADRELRDMMPGSNAPALGGRPPILGGGGGMQTWLRTGADAANTVGAFLAARGIRRKIDDANLALDDQRSAMAELDALTAGGKYPDLIPILRRLAQSERDATEAHLAAMDDEITALDIQTGAGVAGVVSNFVQGNDPVLGGGGGGGGGGLGTALAVGGAGLGLGLLLSNNNNNNSVNSRRRR